MCISKWTVVITLAEPVTEPGVLRELLAIPLITSSRFVLSFFDMDIGVCSAPLSLEPYDECGDAIGGGREGAACHRQRPSVRGASST